MHFASWYPYVRLGLFWFKDTGDRLRDKKKAGEDINTWDYITEGIDALLDRDEDLNNLEGKREADKGRRAGK